MPCYKQISLLLFSEPFKILSKYSNYEWMNEWIYSNNKNNYIVQYTLLIINCWKEGNKKYNTYSDYPQY